MTHIFYKKVQNTLVKKILKTTYFLEGYRYYHFFCKLFTQYTWENMSFFYSIILGGKVLRGQTALVGKSFENCRKWESANVDKGSRFS